MQTHREEINQQNADQKCRQGDADEGYGQQKPGQQRAWVDAGIDAEWNADRDREQGGDEGELQGGGKTHDEEIDDRLFELIGDAEIEMQGAPQEVHELYRQGIIEAEHDPQARPVCHAGILADHLIDRVADEAEHDEGNKRDYDEDEQGLAEDAAKRRPAWATAAILTSRPRDRRAGRSPVVPA